MSASEFLVDDGNFIDVGNKNEISGYVKGSGNSIIIEESLHGNVINIRVSGNNNNIHIKKSFAIKNLNIRVGNHIPANKTDLKIGDGFSIEGGGVFYLYNSGNKLIIGQNCMFSNGIIVRCGESPHLIFDKNTGDYIDISDGIYIGDHVWVGEKVYITKKVSIASESIVAACSVVTKRFVEQNVVIAGNPAKIVKKDIQWIRNRGFLLKDSPFEKSYYLNLSQYD